MLNVSMSPDGKEYKLPNEKETNREIEELKKITAEQ